MSLQPLWTDGEPLRRQMRGEMSVFLPQLELLPRRGRAAGPLARRATEKQGGGAGRWGVRRAHPSVIFCLSALQCSSPASLFHCVSLLSVSPYPISLLPLCLSILFALLLLLLPLLLSPAPSLMPIIEFSRDCGCPFLQLTLSTFAPTNSQPRCSPFALSLGIQQPSATCSCLQV